MFIWRVTNPKYPTKPAVLQKTRLIYIYFQIQKEEHTGTKKYNIQSISSNLRDNVKQSQWWR